MTKYLFIIFILLLLITCKTTIKKEESNKKSSDFKSNIFERDVNFEFIEFDFSIVEDKSVVSDEEIYNVNYNISFRFRNRNNNFFVNYKLFDENNNVLLERKNVKPIKDKIKKNNFLITDNFLDTLYHSRIKYYLSVEIDNEKKEYEDEFLNKLFPLLDEFSFGPIITKYEDNKVNFSLLINLALKNCREVKWIHFIPPSLDSYWNIPWENNFFEIIASGVIYEKDKNFIENGKYILQINLDKYGIIQKEIEIVDFFNNKTGPNYGLPIASEIEADKNHIRLDMNLLEKIDFMEIWLFSHIGANLQKIGVAKYLTPIEIVSKKELKNMVKDDFDNTVKLKYNKEYTYKVYLYSKEFNNIKYVSISDPFPIKFHGFSFFSF